MKKTYLLGGGIAVLTAAVLVGCNSNDDNGTGSTAATTTSLTITPSLGKILNAKVILRNAKTGLIVGAPAGIAVDNSTGKAVFTDIPIGIPVIAEVKPLNTSTPISYFDEANPGTDGKTFKTITESELGTLRVAIPSVTVNQKVGITAFTEAAVASLGLSENNMLNGDANGKIAAANNSVKQKLQELSKNNTIDLLQEPAVVDSTTSMNNLPNTIQGQYAALLAMWAKTVSTLNTTSTTPALKFLASLRNDAMDGTLDGSGNSEGDIAVFTPQFSAKQLQVAQSFQSAFTHLGDYLKGITFSGGASMSGDFGSMTVASTGTDGSYTFNATTASRVVVNNITTVTWSDGAFIVNISFNSSNQIISALGSSAESSFACVNTGCNGITINSTAKTITFTDTLIADTSIPTDKSKINGTLSFDIATQVTGGIDVQVGSTLTAADLAKLAGTYSGSGELTTSVPINSKTVSCSANISSTGTMSASGGGFSVSLVPNTLSVISNTTVNQQSFKSVTLVEGGLGGIATATAVFNAAGKPYSVSVTKTTINIQNPTAASTTLLSCNFVQNQ